MTQNIKATQSHDQGSRGMLDVCMCVYKTVSPTALSLRPQIKYPCGDIYDTRVEKSNLQRKYNKTSQKSEVKALWMKVK